MKIILISDRKDGNRTLALNNWAKVLLSLCVLGLPLGTGLFLGMQLGGGKANLLLEQGMESLQAELEEQRRNLAEGKRDSRRKVEALARKLAEMQARLVRLDALGERLTEMADLESGEFDFSQVPPVGGPETLESEAVEQADLEALFAQLDAQLQDREDQLRILQSMMSDRKVSREIAVAGRPINKGWMSSGYGRRTDPFNGRKVWHNGVDFAGKLGADVVAVASGVVTWSGEYKGYGQMVELDHGEGFVTRYAHNKDNIVKEGDIVKKGQVIARMGSSGRSTGPHVHFEVYKHGRPVDPASYIRRTIR